MTVADPEVVARRALVCLDLTDLNDACDVAAIDALCRRARTPRGSVAAVCIWPRFVAQAKVALAQTGIRVATVVNFPSGDRPLDEVAAETRAALADGADEIDLVVPWRALRRGDDAAVGDAVREIKAVCGTRTLKAILETGELGDPALIGLAAAAAIDGGADFLKTSTGKVKVNATPEAAELLLRAISRSGAPVGFKASGGVRSTADAGVYLALADEIMGAGWAGPKRFRFGASGLLGALLETLKAGDPDEDDEDY